MLKRRYDKAEKAYVEAGIAKGLSADEIAAKLPNRTPTSVYNHALNVHGVRLPVVPRKKPKAAPPPREPRKRFIISGLRENSHGTFQLGMRANNEDHARRWQACLDVVSDVLHDPRPGSKAYGYPTLIRIFEYMVAAAMEKAAREKVERNG